MKKFVNLLPEDERNSVKSEYRIRRRIVSFSLFIVLILIGILMLTPSYINARLRLKEAKNNLASVKQLSQTGFEDLDVIIKSTIENISIISADEKVANVNELIDKIIAVKKPEIQIDSFFFSQDASLGEYNLVIRGIARNRESIVSYTEMLREIAEFDSVEVPVSNFAKDRDIDFTISLTGKKI